MLIIKDILPGWEGHKNVNITDIDNMSSLKGRSASYTVPLMEVAPSPKNTFHPSSLTNLDEMV